MLTARSVPDSSASSEPTNPEAAAGGLNAPTGPLDLETVDCLLCGGSGFETVIARSDPTTGIGGNFRIVRCRDCRLSFTNPRPRETDIGLFYPDEYGPYIPREWNQSWRGRVQRGLERSVLRTHYGYPPQPLGRWTALLARLGRAGMRRSRQRQSWIPFREPGRLLDFGCGAGDFLRRMQEFGWSVEGLDMSSTVAGRLQTQTGIRVHVGTFPHPDILPDSYDAVTMWHSLEHVHHPREVVRSAATALRSRGILVVGVPNFASWSFKHFQKSWYALELPRHLSHFTPETLCELLGREGFQVLSLQHIARSGCLRKSAHRAAKSGWGPWWLRACRWKPMGLPVANWTERTQQADFIRVIAEKVR